MGGGVTEGWLGGGGVTEAGWYRYGGGGAEYLLY